MAGKLSLTRRGFLRHSAAALSAAWAAPTVILSPVFAAGERPVPSQRIAVGMIGMGRQA